MIIKKDKDSTDDKYVYLQNENQKQIERYDQLNDLIHSKEKNLLVLLMEKEQMIRDLGFTIESLEKDKILIAKDVQYYKDKSDKRY